MDQICSIASKFAWRRDKLTFIVTKWPIMISSHEQKLKLSPRNPFGPSLVRSLHETNKIDSPTSTELQAMRMESRICRQMMRNDFLSLAMTVVHPHLFPDKWKVELVEIHFHYKHTYKSRRCDCRGSNWVTRWNNGSRETWLEKFISGRSWWKLMDYNLSRLVELNIECM